MDWRDRIVSNSEILVGNSLDHIAGRPGCEGRVLHGRP